jgi:EAL domain-containing protein (putative c-di-GMP-specific phosphodiesterase class I)
VTWEAGAAVETTHVAERVRVASVPRTLRTASDLDAALDGGLLTVAYQPVLSLITGEVVAAEALVRLRDPDTGQLRAPDSFIPLAEATGRIARIDRMVLELAVPLAVEWRAAMPGRPLSVGVNVSVVGLADPVLPTFVERVCAEAGLPCDALVIEVTETALSRPDCGHERVLHDIHALGCNVTLDDFGTGYSSLSHLMRFPVDGIKIDRHFVWEIGGANRGARLPAALVRLGLELGLHVVAEGVETAAQVAALQQAGCPFAQGFLFAEPLPPDDLAEFLHANASGVRLPRSEAP